MICKMIWDYVCIDFVVVVGGGGGYVMIVVDVDGFFMVSQGFCDVIVGF